MKNCGISLTGGGARGSYQAGVLKALAEVLQQQGLTGSKNPFRNFCGVSAGAINATYCASRVDDLPFATSRLVELWKHIEPKNVYNTDVISMSKTAYRWTRDLTMGSMFKNKLAHSLLDTAPLWNLVKQIEYDSIQKNIDKGLLDALACSAYSFTDNRTVTFLQTKKDISWDKPRRYSRNTVINEEHVMASCAIPLLFPAIQHKKEYFGDGSFRNTAPLSSILQMGSTKNLLVGVRGPDEFSDRVYKNNPGVAKVSGLMLNALFFDTIDIDLERSKQINEFITALQNDITTKRSAYTGVDFHIIKPSRDISKIACDNSKKFPRLVKFLIGSLGSPAESAELASYLLFVPAFTGQLLELGYEDFYKQKAAFIRWLES